jgi:A/G-specific adenine glycosylase
VSPSRPRAAHGLKKDNPDPDDLGPRLLAWFDRARRDLPWRRTRDPYRIWVSEVMLQQTQVERVIPYYRRFLRAFPTARALARAPLDEVLRAWEGLGYYSRARNLHAACRQVAEKHGGRFPEGHEDALALPGVGRYIAGAVLSIAYGQRLAAIDANARRVLSRTFPGVRGRELESMGLHAVPQERPGDFNQALMELGALICVPWRPRCSECCLADICRANLAGRAAPASQTRRSRRVTGRVALGIVERAGRVLIAQRPPRGVWGGLWEFPNVEIGPRGDGPQLLRDLLLDHFGLTVRVGEDTTRLTHGIMNRRIEIIAYPCTVASGRTRTKRHTSARWVKLDELGRYALPAPHRRLAELITPRAATGATRHVAASATLRAAPRQRAT